MFKNTRLDLRSKRATRSHVPLQHSSHERAIVEHVSRHLAPPAFVLHEIIPFDVPSTSNSLDASTRLTSLLVVAPEVMPDETITSGTAQIELLTLLPLYAEELDYKVQHGLDALLDAFTAAGISEVVDPERPSAIGDRVAA